MVRYDDQPRRKADLGMIGVVLTMLLQFGGMVWGAATLTAAVDELRRITVRLEASDARRSTTEQVMLERLKVLEVRVDRLERFHDEDGR